MKLEASRSNQMTAEESIVDNSKPNVLYSHDFGNGRFFQVVHQDTTGFQVKLATKTMLKVVFITDKDDIEGLHITKLVHGNETQKLDLSKFNFQQLRAFLKFIESTDLKSVPESKMALVGDEELSDETKRRIKLILAQEGGEELIRSLIDEGIVTSVDVVNTAYRKRQLEIFKEMVTNPEYWKE